MKKTEPTSSKRATSIKNKIKQSAKKNSVGPTSLKLPELNMHSLKNKSASTRFQSQSPNPSRTKISDQDFQIKGKNLDSNTTKANSEYSNSSHFEKVDHRVRNINAWVSSYRDKSKGHIKNKLSAKKLFAKDE